MGYLKQINVENFKSWRGKQVIGPFKRFNCIIGTNGSGKSNVMDALSFVMGERASSLRVKHTKDLIHGAHIGKPVAGTASVTMLYCEDNGEELSFCRRIAGTSSEYRINDKQVTHAKYTAELERIGVVVKARNCLVFQGAVESISMKNPKERARMFELISGSHELAEEYDKKKELLQRAKEETQFHFNKKKTATAEKRQISLEKVEAQKYQTLVDDLNDAKVQLNLCQLYHNEQGIGALMDSLRERQLEVAGRKGGLEVWEAAVKAQKKEHGRLSRELQQIEKEITAQEKTLGQQRPQYIKAKVNTAHHQRKAEEAHAALQKGRKQQQRKEQELEELRGELAELERAWGSFQKKLEEEGAARDVSVQLEAAQLERYKELKEMARRQGAILSQQAEKLRWEVKADYEKLEFDQRRRKEVEANIKYTQTQLESYATRAEKLEEYANSCNSTLAKNQQQEESLVKQLEEGRVRSGEVNQELGEVLRELQDARMDNQESRRQQRRQEVLDSLKRLYPDTMYGRLFDLCNPIHKKYQLAAAKVFGRYMNAIVVASEKVARDCIKFLKEERAEPETFLPIDYLDVNPLNERLREIRGAKVVVDVVQCASNMPQLKKVLQFVCGNALVCETLKEARQIAFGGPVRHKTVALDGTMFSKSGEISGGSLNLRSKARRWEEKEMSQLKERKEQLTTELRELMKLKRKEAELKQVQAQMLGIQTRLKYSNSELETIRKKNIPACHTEISRLESELTNVDSLIMMQKENVEKKDASMTEIYDRVKQIEDTVFSEFCAEIGVDNIREYEQEHLKHQQEVDKKCLEFESQRTRLSAQLEYEQGQLEQEMRKIESWEGTVRKEEEKAAFQKKEEEKLLKAVDETQSKILDLKNQHLGKKSQASDSKAEVDKKVKSLQEKSRELVKLQKEVISLETSLEQKRMERHNLLLGCKIQGLPITLISGSLDQITEVQLDSETQSTGTTLDIYEREAQLLIDYEDLKQETRDLEGAEELEAEVGRLQEVVSSLEGVLQRSTAPNLKALEKIKEVKDMYQGVVDAFEASTKMARKCSQEFEQIKAKRFRLFSQCFEHVSIIIDQIYKELCRNSSAQAILGAENPDEPYLDGINYNCVAPGKRFMAMDNLSGGEKSVAALALVFAIHSFRPAPFLVMDEVDAALDNTNIGKVTSYIREKSREHFQIIVISLKEEFYSKADALLGVYSEFNECMYSRLLTLDLTPYPLKEGNEKEKEMLGEEKMC
ncbi:structural maintenance of chromosomes protein 1B isoform X1 [Anguilla anguilla]|uniref:structural maintenance of chromosomes protein 1B isoform X1 n=2 Tax=Anguilla anguilla TaxID=7936 RepID=UPI0015B1757F|nr:structural maintenance of chromosomes protein 1B isoform X1 [Anguilla anguilla]